MNKVYRRFGKKPLTATELAAEANAIIARKPFTAAMFDGLDSRIQGAGHCDCNGDGEFELLPVHHPDVQDGKKRYMICRKCGCYSHL